ncbi:unnamed protein product [Adineta steineri]|uniref:AAA+ ATPase domain-containing protein n=1 Tax=Adineta steineri TaxID=433720 RepID=A0A813YF61_9BILA|nr:unnamed protein product [Adineta steineri]CAF0886670.1 unnamed protein product [Adineta steineri]CAF1164981.1 unnamed protein product [Adineta steineri]
MKMAASNNDGKYETVPVADKHAGDELQVEDQNDEDHNTVVLPAQLLRDIFDSFKKLFIIIHHQVHDKSLVCVGKTQNVRLALPGPKMKMSRVIRKNLNILLNDVVTFDACQNIIEGERLEVAPIYDTINGLTGSLLNIFLIPYFRIKNPGRPVNQGEFFIVRAAMRAVEFQVIKTVPEPYCIVGPKTKIVCKDVPVKREEVKSSLNEVGYDSIGAVKKQLASIKEMAEFTLRHQPLIKLSGATLAQRILLYGPPGTGKTLVARAVANETGASFFLISGQEMMSKLAGDEEVTLTKVFEEAVKKSSAIIFIDELDAIVRKRQNTHGEVECCIVSQLLTIMENLKQHSHVLFMAATNQPNDIDSKRFGFNLEVDLNIADDDVNGRLEILLIHTKNWNLHHDVNLEQIAKETPGYVGGNLVSLCSEAYLQQLREKKDIFVPGQDTYPVEKLDLLCITEENFRVALELSKKTVLRKSVSKKKD